MTLKVIQGYCKWHKSISHMILPTSGVYQQRVYLQGNSPVAGLFKCNRPLLRPQNSRTWAGPAKQHYATCHSLADAKHKRVYWSQPLYEFRSPSSCMVWSLTAPAPETSKQGAKSFRGSCGERRTRDAKGIERYVMGRGYPPPQPKLRQKI